MVSTDWKQLSDSIINLIMLEPIELMVEPLESTPRTTAALLARALDAGMKT